MLNKRKTEGEYWTLYREIMDDKGKFFQYFPLSQYQFTELLAKSQSSDNKEDKVSKGA
jgi:hypothetical protein